MTIKELRQQTRLTQQKFAEKIPHISRIRTLKEHKDVHR